MIVDYFRAGAVIEKVIRRGVNFTPRLADHHTRIPDEMALEKHNFNSRLANLCKFAQFADDSLIFIM